jgi:hypothetical protein
MQDAFKLLKFKAVTYGQNLFQTRDAKKKKSINNFSSEQKLVLPKKQNVFQQNVWAQAVPFHSAKSLKAGHTSDTLSTTNQH